MAVLQMTVFLPYPMEAIWDVVTHLEDTAWRSDLERVEILSDTQFVEYDKNGFVTTFTITVCVPPERWEFTMENGNMSGHWTGEFQAVKDGTRLIFTETVNAKRWWMRPFVPGYLKRQQKHYLEDLQKKLLENGRLSR